MKSRHTFDLQAVHVVQAKPEGYAMLNHEESGASANEDLESLN